jgi:hypothetical protein
MAFVEGERMLGSLIRAQTFAIPFNRKWFLINRTYSINTTAGSVNQSKSPSSPPVGPFPHNEHGPNNPSAKAISLFHRR